MSHCTAYRNRSINTVANGRREEKMYCYCNIFVARDRSMAQQRFNRISSNRREIYDFYNIWHMDFDSMCWMLYACDDMFVIWDEAASQICHHWHNLNVRHFSSFATIASSFISAIARRGSDCSERNKTHIKIIHDGTVYCALKFQMYKLWTDDV